MLATPCGRDEELETGACEATGGLAKLVEGRLASLLCCVSLALSEGEVSLAQRVGVKF